MTALDLIIVWLCLISITRIITYRRDGARFKRQYSIVAWLLICGIGAVAIYIVGGQLCSMEYPLLLPVMMILTMALMYTRGNVAPLVNLRRLLHG